MSFNSGPYTVTPTVNNQFERLGIPGRFHSAITVSTTTTASFTGSNYGAGAFMLGNGSNTAGTQIFVVGGGTIAGNDLNTGSVYEIAPIKIQSTGGNIYVFKRQQ